MAHKQYNIFQGNVETTSYGGRVIFHECIRKGYGDCVNFSAPLDEKGKTTLYDIGNGALLVKEAAIEGNCSLVATIISENPDPKAAEIKSKIKDRFTLKPVK